jgi:hypothetical protein
MERRRAESWSGSENNRREQGVCLPPKRPSSKLPRFQISQGCPCEISKVSPLEWQHYRTTKDLGFEFFETYRDHKYVFRDRGYFLRVNRVYVSHRDDG